VGRRLIITIDGPAGAGKSTAAKGLAKALGYRYLDSGALYRAVAWEALRRRLDMENSEAWEDFLQGFKPEIVLAEADLKLYLDGQEVSRELRTPEVSRAASRVAAVPQVRQWVNACLRRLAPDRGVVAEGRDLGSVVFPDAEVKFFLTADLATRATRRRREWQNANLTVDLEKTIQELVSRDRQDETRAAAPLRVPEGAVCLDTTTLSPEEVVNTCLAEVREALTRPGQS